AVTASLSLHDALPIWVAHHSRSPQQFADPLTRLQSARVPSVDDLPALGPAAPSSQRGATRCQIGYGESPSMPTPSLFSRDRLSLSLRPSGPKAARCHSDRTARPRFALSRCLRASCTWAAQPIGFAERPACRFT